MKKILVCGLANVETSCRVSGFPVEYCPVDYNFFGIDSVASGVGLNIALALQTLGDEVTFLSMLGDDTAGDAVRAACKKAGLSTRFLPCEKTPESVVLYDESGKRRIFTDLKNLQDLRVDEETFRSLSDADAFCLCNIHFNRDLLPVARELKKPIFTDVHCISDVYDSYNADFMRYSDVLFLSNENIMGREEEFVRELSENYPCSLIIVGMAQEGVLLFEKKSGAFSRLHAINTRPVVNTVGAGDALFSAFVHYYMAGMSAYDALDRAAFFASYKIGESGASKGFLAPDVLEALFYHQR